MSQAGEVAIQNASSEADLKMVPVVKCSRSNRSVDRKAFNLNITLGGLLTVAEPASEIYRPVHALASI